VPAITSLEVGQLGGDVPDSGQAGMALASSMVRVVAEPKGAPRGRAAGKARADREQVRAQGVELLLMPLVATLGDADQGDHGGHADDDAQHRERRPHLAGAEAADGQLEQVR